MAETGGPGTRRAVRRATVAHDQFHPAAGLTFATSVASHRAVLVHRSFARGICRYEAYDRGGDDTEAA
jgi:hypothetical protein